MDYYFFAFILLLCVPWFFVFLKIYLLTYCEMTQIERIKKTLKKLK